MSTSAYFIATEELALSVSGRSDASDQLSAEAGPSVADLLGVLSYGALVAFDNLAVDARLAPDLRRRAALSEMAAAELVHYRRLADRLAEIGVDPVEAMTPFVTSLDAYHQSTRPKDWLEGLVKAYVGDGIADDFYREVAASLAEPDRTLVLEVLHDDRHAGYAVAEVRAAVAVDPTLAGRLGLWARRLVAEAVTQAQLVVAARPALVALVEPLGSGEPAGLAALIDRLTAGHTARLQSLGLKS
ncbi:ferritin-like fold-containing protein [Cryptosporangium aurantiacum]|uniref:tRNA-(MS[2]IO[6]A)-hydroxylase (MiaE)-like n=1 Tax=Cryptosporangium aurantiacum TaxID=134849 RepID=A0A1M7QP67_9ACTN|nr:ferritin-like fold-containing protein [Cryptosporangium aurantiacum]SHN33189.1 tRNA-(MS[2]IO[6]A)-hydroxylase (MiaE)-like [Cryptosporangium aurantiacum]